VILKSDENVKLSSSEIGSFWGEYVNGTAAECINKYKEVV
jgi:hypothetical protein